MNLNKLILTALCAIIMATAAYAAGENVVASKKYTDDTFQTKIPAEVSTLSNMTGNAGALIGATDANGVVSQRLIIPGYKSARNNGELGAAMYQQSNDGTEPWGSWNYAADEFTAMLEDIYRQYNDGNGMGYDPKYSVPSMELALNWVGDIWNKKQPMIPALGHAMEYSPGFVLLPSGGDDGQLTARFIIPGLDEMPYLPDSGRGYDVRDWWLFGGEINENDVTAMLDYISRDLTNNQWINGERVTVTLKDVLYSPASLKLVSDVWNGSQRTITGHAANAADSILTDSATNGVVQKRAIFDGSATYAAGTHATHIPTMGAVMSAITNGTPKITWSATQTAAVNNYSTTFNGTANNWVATDSGKLVDGAVLANAVALKQNKIPAEVSWLRDVTGGAGALIGATDANGVVSQRLIIPGYKSASGNGELGLVMYQQSSSGTVPWGSWEGYSTDEFDALLDDIYRYFNDGNGMGYDPKYSVPSMELALNWVLDIWNGSQRTITGHAANAADSILTDSATNGVVQKRAIFDGSATYAAGTHATHIPTMGAVMSAITNGTPKITWSATQTAAVNNYSTTFNGTANNWVATDSGKLVDGAVLANAVALKQNKIAATTTSYTYDATNRPNADGSLVATTATAGTVTERPIVSAATYDSTTGALTNGSAIPNVTALDTRQKKKVCAGWPDDVAVADRTDANCWLWYFPD